MCVALSLLHSAECFSDTLSDTFAAFATCESDENCKSERNFNNNFACTERKEYEA